MATTRWSIVSSVVVLTLVMGSSPLRGEEGTEQIIADLKAKAAAIKSYQADITITMEMMGKKMSMPGKILVKKPNKSRTEMVTEMGSVKMEQIHICDGKTMWIHQPKMNMVMRIDMEKVVAETKKESAGEAAPDICNTFESFQPESISHIRTEEIDGSKVCVFRGLPAKSDAQKIPFAPAKIELWIGADDGVIRKNVFFNEEGKEMMSQAFTNIQLNIEVADSRFEFTPPEGTQVMDMTEGTINMIKEMKEGTE